MAENPPILPDLLDVDLQLVFCGTAASSASAKAKAYYAGPGNRFWPTLFHIGLTPYSLAPEEFRQLLDYKIGLTDIAKYTSGQDHQLQALDFDTESLQRKIEDFSPAILAFSSKKAAKVFFQCKSIDYGLQSGTIHNTKVFVLPSPSGAARGFWNIQYWYDLAALVKGLTAK